MIAFACASQYGIAVSRQEVSQTIFEGLAIVRADANKSLLSNASTTPAVLPCRWFGMSDLGVRQRVFFWIDAAPMHVVGL